MYLKQIKAIGFKSFGIPTIIKFHQGLTGVIGPNGSGKSNINDAIKWVLGEQSFKSLRSKNSNDVIFSGSDDRDAVNMAEVTLLFDNSDKLLKSEFSEVEIKRRVYRDSGENEYYVNKERCRLRDVHDIIADTGLGKNTLGIIGQGTINNFIETNAQERRKFFEEAAGVANYRKRKVKSLRDLEDINNKIIRIKDVYDELAKRMPTLKRQSEKAIRYQNIKKKLDGIEISFLAYKINEIKEKTKDIKTTIEIADSELVKLKATLSNKNLDYTTEKSKLDVVETKINDLEIEKINLERDLENIENIQKNSRTNIGIDEKKKVGFIEKTSQDIIENTSKLKTYRSKLEKLNIETENLQLELNNLQSQNSKDINFNNDLTQKIVEAQLKKKSLQEQLENNSNLGIGVRNVLKTYRNKNGVYDVVDAILKPEENFLLAYGLASKSFQNNIIVDDKKIAKNMIDFLKLNKAGTATFVPLSHIEPRFIFQEYEIALGTQKGYLGTLNKFIACDDNMDTVRDYFFGNVIIVDTIENAINISEFIENKHKIITLDGQVINAGGIMSGGYVVKQANSIPIIKNSITKLDLIISKANQQLNQLNYSKDNLEINDLHTKITENTTLQIKYDANIENIITTNDKLKNEYKHFSGKDFTIGKLSDSDNNLLDKISGIKINLEKNKIEHINALKVKKTLQETASTLESEHLELNERFSSKHAENEEAKTIINNEQVKLENYINRLAVDYNMTEEHALGEFLTNLENLNEIELEVNTLRKELDSIGNINIDAIEEYKNEKIKYDNFESSLTEFNESQSKILESINEMDKVVVKQFSDIIEKINKELTYSFNRMFGGGSANLIYTDPDNILETGIEVNVHPPGKKVTNLNLLSGGEKSLVALSVLFAILKVKPIPLSILDEAESQLDIGNVVRFIEYIKSFKNQQFIVITHRPGTMEKCDVLYGVTMQEKGVTSLVKVTINEAIKYIDDDQVDEEELNLISKHN